MTRLRKTAGLLALLFFCLAARLPALGGGEKKSAARQTPENGAGNTALSGSSADGGETEPQNRLVRVSGRVRMVGTGIFPEIVITGDGREWHVDKAEQFKLTDLQQRIVTVEGSESYADLTFANGLPAGRRYTLKNIKLVNIE